MTLITTALSRTQVLVSHGDALQILQTAFQAPPETAARARTRSQ